MLFSHVQGRLMYFPYVVVEEAAIVEETEEAPLVVDELSVVVLKGH